MQFILVNSRSHRQQSFCKLCCEPIVEDYLREIATRFSYCSLKCYAGHCTTAVLRLEHHARAS